MKKVSDYDLIIGNVFKQLPKPEIKYIKYGRPSG